VLFQEPCGEVRAGDLEPLVGVPLVGQPHVVQHADEEHQLGVVVLASSPALLPGGLAREQEAAQAVVAQERLLCLDHQCVGAPGQPRGGKRQISRARVGRRRADHESGGGHGATHHDAAGNGTGHQVSSGSQVKRCR
jgi:hypothetical protein